MRFTVAFLLAIGVMLVVGIWAIEPASRLPVVELSQQVGSRERDVDGEVGNGHTRVGMARIDARPAESATDASVVGSGSVDAENPVSAVATADLSAVKILAEANSVASRRGWQTRFSLEANMDLRARSAIRSAHVRFQAEVEAIEAVRMPIVKSLADMKFDAGLVEVSPGRAELKSMSRKERRALAVTLRPKKEGQTVVSRTVGGKVLLARVDSEEHPMLKVSYDRYHSAEEMFVQEVLLFVNPIK